MRKTLIQLFAGFGVHHLNVPLVEFSLFVLLRADAHRDVLAIFVFVPYRATLVFCEPPSESGRVRLSVATDKALYEGVKVSE